jgi:hypothetical protein
MDDVPRFVVVRVDRRGESPPAYVRRFEMAGRNGLRQLAFGPATAAHLFDRRADAETVARRLGRRVSQSGYDFIVEEAPVAALAATAEERSA